MTALVLKAPLAGWCMPLAEVPDPVFAQAMAGDGLAIDPTGNTVHAPCDGEIVPMKDAKHAVTVRSASGIDVLVGKAGGSLKSIGSLGIANVLTMTGCHSDVHCATGSHPDGRKPLSELEPGAR